ncbi:sugar phosphate isomerase/epimerase family protein [Microbacterium rhizomatis]|uniref:Sugar phosphate isomerase/epimerase n=1 Tax=Microbacterium rhizomatis TaxID=1631477 RepID=A0A5J5IYL6_9MICO|nr:sugar phosphate isomerase/epimerase [Microbacterium rhizomatis]KAA9106601.1 sugar phosphate isomerase/epimerase [Microbacterium rhizomatis]
MRIAFSKPVAPDEFPTLLAEFGPAGYDALQLKTGQFLPWLHSRAEFAALTRGHEGASAVLVYFDELDDDRLADVLDFAKEVGTETVVFCHNRSREGITTDERVQLARQLEAHGKRARDAGIRLSLHHHFDQPVMLPEDVREFWSAIEPGAVGLTVDTAHLAKSGVTDIPGFIREFAPIIDNIHLKDYAEGEWRLVGQGELDLDGILAALADIGFDGWLCIDEESTASLDDGLRISHAWLDKHLAPAP